MEWRGVGDHVLLLADIETEGGRFHCTDVGTGGESGVIGKMWGKSLSEAERRRISGAGSLIGHEYRSLMLLYWTATTLRWHILLCRFRSSSPAHLTQMTGVVVGCKTILAQPVDAFVSACADHDCTALRQLHVTVSHMRTLGER
jgi:hypothetical protein